MNRSDWLAKRRKGIGGSDAAAIAGLSPWKTPLEVYLDKIGEGVDEETPDMRRGTLFEPVVRQMYCDATGRTVEKPGGILVHPKIRWMLANLDGIASGDRLAEFKTARTRQGWGDPGSSDVPMWYMLQVQHYLAVTGFAWADLAVLFGDFELAIYPIESDTDLQELLIEREAEFWAMVQSRTPPEPVTANDVKRRWPMARVPVTNEATPEVLHVAAVLKAVKARIKELEGVQDQAETVLKRAIADTEGLAVQGEVLATWKNVKGSPYFDKERFRVEHPKLYTKYISEPSPQRRFLLKGNCKCLPTITMASSPEIPANLLAAPDPAPA